LGVYFGYMGAKTPGWTDPLFFMVVDIRDVITCFKFGDDRFRGLASAGWGSNFAIPHWLHLWFNFL